MVDPIVTCEGPLDGLRRVSSRSAFEFTIENDTGRIRPIQTWRFLRLVRAESNGDELLAISDAHVQTRWARNRIGDTGSFAFSGEIPLKVKDRREENIECSPES